MNKKGFTLMELLTVVTLIGLLSLIIIPNITENIKKKKIEIDTVNQKILEAATDVYIQNNPITYNYNYEANGSTYCIPIQTLINEGILETPFKNVNGQEIDYSNQVKATYQPAYNGFSYELVEKENCTEVIQYVNRPILTENMIPVIYDEKQNKWVKADANSNWYNYSEKNWANAVLVKENKTEEENSKSRLEYLKSPSNTPILDSDIIAQFVWIPRFKYQLFNSNTEEQINIIFEKTSKTKSTGTETGQWLTHPAFTYNNQELAGFWIAKYEGTNQNNNIIIKNQTPWTNIDYVEANKKIIEMTYENNIYGLKDVNTHMTRNSEWGALAFISNSQFGGRQNNSTTGNITGVYNTEGNKEFVIVDNENENSLGYALNETKNWSSNNSYITNENQYLTRGNTSIYSYNNSKVIDENTTFRMAIINTETQNQNYQKKYTVTLDPNGGTLSETTKEVSYHEPYGNLPTPTREGYTFMGWNGKNLVNIPDHNVTYTNWYYKEESSTPKYTLKPNTTYTLSFDYLVNSSTKDIYASIGYGTTGYLKDVKNPYKSTYSGTGHKTVTMTAPNEFLYSPPDVYFRLVRTSEPGDVDVDISNVQFEENIEATEYEPYYITPSTTVVQDKDHTLKAIWQANS
jgi:prepilin-type N-terminal cleavage/methylation domain-containing protein/uncharacterized repeat protein (TIGR02543 family)